MIRRKYINLGSITGILCNIVLFVIKLSIGLLAGSVSIMADAFNNLTDIGSSVVTIIGFRLSIKPADKEHPFGHGRFEYMSAMLVAIIILLVGFELLKSSVEKIFSPTDLKVEFYTIILLCISVIIKLWMFLFNKKLGKSINSSGLIATAQDSINDSIATFAVLISIIICSIFKINIDPYMGIIVALFILYSGIKTIKETLDPLLGMPPEKETIDAIATMVLANENFVGIHDLIVHNYGPGRSFASLHVEVPSNADIVACHEDIDACEKEIHNTLGIEVVIHMDPIAVDDENTIKTKEAVIDAIKKYDSRLSVHDFRMVNGEEQINLIFDVVVPNEIKLKDSEIKAKIDEICKQIDARYVTVLTLDKDYISDN
ncbi:MAG: cation transporter [Clostridia bacterium]|nr:cation transporter [Clostridia bacterium]